MKKKTVIILILAVTWIVVGVFWSDEFLGLFKHEAKMAMISQNFDEAPVKEAEAKPTIMMSLQTIVTGMAALANIIGGVVLLWQKILGKR